MATVARTAFSSLFDRPNRLRHSAWLRFEPVLMRARVLRAASHRRRAVWIWELALRETTSHGLRLIGEPNVLPPISRRPRSPRRQAKLSLELAREIRAQAHLGRAELANLYGVSKPSINKILAGTAWKEIA